MKNKSNSGGENDVPRRVGYKCPPVKTRFQPGQSGNPKGRPKGPRNLIQLLNKLMNETIAVRIGDKPKKMTMCEAIFRQLVNKAASGDLKAYAELMKRIPEPQSQEPAVVYTEIIPEFVYPDNTNGWRKDALGGEHHNETTMIADEPQRQAEVKPPSWSDHDEATKSWIINRILKSKADRSSK